MDYRLHGIPGAVLRRARQRADEEGADLARVLIDALTAYADGLDSPAAQFGSRGGKASAAALTADERRQKARRAVAVRWAKHPDHQR